MLLALLLATTLETSLQQRVEAKIEESLPGVIALHKQHGLAYDPLPAIKAVEYANSQAATYVPAEHTIYFNLRTDVVDEETIIAAVPHNLSHELAHHQTELRTQAMEGRLTTDREKYRALPQAEQIGHLLIIEGIGSYYESLVTPTPSCDLCISPRTAEQWIALFEAGIMHPYDVGHALVKPILEQYGRDGLDHLVMFPPTSKDVEDLQAYQCKALEELRARIKR